MTTISDNISDDEDFEECTIPEPRIVGFVLNMQNLENLKKELIDIIRCAEIDERFYTYYPDKLQIPQLIGQQVAELANFEPIKNFSYQSIKATLSILSAYDGKRYIFVFLDHYDDSQEYRLKQAMRYKKNKDFDVQVFICYIGNNEDAKIAELFPNEHLHFDDLSQLKDRLLEIMSN